MGIVLEMPTGYMKALCSTHWSSTFDIRAASKPLSLRNASHPWHFRWSNVGSREEARKIPLNHQPLGSCFNFQLLDYQISRSSFLILMDGH